MKRLSLLTAVVLSLALVAGLTYLHLSRMSTAADPDRAASRLASHKVWLSESTEPAPERSGAFIIPPKETAPHAPAPTSTPVYDEIREVDLDEAYDHLHSIALDTRLARLYVQDLGLIARDADLPEDLRRLAVWGLARGGDLESVRSLLVDSNAPDVQLTALEMLRRHEGQKAFDLIAAQAREARDPRVRESALRSLGHLDGRFDVQPFLGDDDVSVRATALDLLSHGRHEALDALLEHAPQQEVETIALARALSSHGHSPDVISRIDELARQPALSPAAIRSIALSRRYAEHPELTAVACSGHSLRNP